MEKQELHLYTNALIHESSPYLLQHAHNPVHWYPYGEEAFTKARKEDKLMLFSIGYSACHWCHVMEQESFEDESVAELMNRYFVCVKVDREERPDIDQIYLEAVQKISNTGGWPLNCFALPDGKPIWGGTYFQPHQWRSVLQNLSDGYRQNPNKYLRVAEDLTKSIQDTVFEDVSDLMDNSDLLFCFDKITQMFDTENGGLLGAPKFPMPGFYETLLDYAILYQSSGVLDHIELTLQKWAYSGLYDALGGGFSRYAVDKRWQIPHFEKMLYDNAQMLSLYAKMYQVRPKPVYKRVMEETIQWMFRDLKTEQGLLSAALDADSGGREGAFYVWSEREIESVLGFESKQFIDYYGVTFKGNFEGENILHTPSMQEPSSRIQALKNTLFHHREKRIRPQLDHKTIVAWNALAVSGLIQVYWATSESLYLHQSETLARKILENKTHSRGLLLRLSDDNSNIEGFLDDYAYTIKAFLDLYEATLNSEWLTEANGLLKKVQERFGDKKSALYYYVSEATNVLVRKKEIEDNVMPSSNAVMSENLCRLSVYTDNANFREHSLRMNRSVQENVSQNPFYHYSWLKQQVYYQVDKKELVVVGKSALEQIVSLRKTYFPALSVIGTTQSQEHHPLFKGRWVEHQTRFYYCVNNTCQLPENDIENLRKKL